MSSELPFERMGPYRIERLLGRGGMGMVFAARHEQSGEPAAVKVLSPMLALNTSYRERFDTEVESLRQLRHPNIVRLYGFGEEHGHLFYAMELVPGCNLQQELTAGRRFQWREVASIAIQICSALKHAHDHGIVHRDLKPANLLWTEQEQIKLSDFGIAKLFGGTMVTQGGVLGTADYMAPEQARGENSGYRSDLYSLGAVMYALLTGKPPHTGKTLPEVLHKLRYEQPVPVGRMVQDLPAEMEQIVMSLLEKDARLRIPTALAVSNRLQAMQHALSVVMPPELSVPTEPPAVQMDQLAQQPTIAVDLDERGRPLDSHLDASIISTQPPPDDRRTPPSDRSHFTSISSEELDEAAEGEAFWRSERILPIFGLAAALVIVALLIGYAFAPASADQLYARVMRAMDGEGAGGLWREQDAIRQFLERYPDDPRGEEMEALLSEIELQRLERRLESMARRGRTTSRQQTSAAQQLYLEALDWVPRDLDRAEEILEAIVELGAAAPDSDEELRLVVELATKRLAELRPRSAAWRERHREFISGSLERAASVAANDPHKARAMRYAIVRLYAEKPWAEDLVATARQHLAEADATTDP